MIRHDESEFNFCLLLADKFAPKSLFAVGEQDSCCCRPLVVVDELIVAAFPELLDLF